MKTKKIYLATIFIIFIIGIFNFALAETEGKNTITYSMPKDWATGWGYISGEIISPTITAKINLNEFEAEQKLHFAARHGSLDYGSYVYIVVKNAEGKKNIEFDNSDGTDYKNITDSSVTVDENNVATVKFTWNLKASQFITKGSLQGKDTSSFLRLGVSIYSPGGSQIASAGGYGFYLSDKDVVAPKINCETDKWYNDQVEVTIRSAIAIQANQIKYKLTGATETEDYIIVSGETAAKFNISNDGITTIEASYTDPKGRTSPTGTYKIKIDKEKPEIVIDEPENDNQNAGLLKVTVTDVNNANGYSDINNDSLKYFWSTEYYENADMINNNLFKKGFTSGSNIRLEEKSGNYYLYVMAKDNAGNVSKQRSNRSYIVDEEGPKVKVTPEGIYAYGNTLDIKVEITDELSGVNKDSIMYLWNTDGRRPESGSFKDKINVEELEDISNGVRFTVPLLENMNTKYYLYIYAKDKMNNGIISGAYTYLLDNEKPEIKLDVSSGASYKNKYYVKITASEKNGIDESSLKYFWSTENYEIDRINEDLFLNAESFKNGFSISTEGLKTDGIYHLYVKAADNAGNIAFYKSGQFYLDVTSPKIKVEPTNNDKKLGEKDLDIEITISDTSDISVKKYLWVNNSYDDPSVNDMISLDGNIVKLPTDEGEYYLWIYAKDSAGNDYIKQKFGKFIIDNTPPSEPQIIARYQTSNAEISNGSATKPNVELEIKKGTDNRENAIVELTFEITKNNLKIENDELELLKDGEKYILKENGTYVVTATNKDDAGNSSTSTFEFRIDDTVPTIPKIKLIDDDDIEEGTINDNSVVKNNVRVEVKNADNETTDIIIYNEKDEDVTSEFKNGDNIVINKSGYYKIVFITYNNNDEDKSNSIQSEMHVTIDNIAPTVSNKTHTIKQDEPHSHNLEATDSGEITYEIVENPKHGEISNFSSTYGTFTYTPYKGYYGEDSFKFTATDKAGNVSNIATVTITIRKTLIESDIITNSSDKSITIKTNETYTSNPLILKDLNNIPLKYTVNKNAVNGSVVFNTSTGILTYTPKQDYSGTDTFTIRVSNGFDTIDIVFTVQVKEISSGHGGGGGRRWWRWKHHYRKNI